MSNEEILEKVKSFASIAHGDQQRKYTPEPYIVHPIRVMKICREYTEDIAVLSAALLHDVLEDTSVTLEQLHNFLISIMDVGTAKRTLDYVVELTDVYTKKNYPQWNRRKRKQKETERMEKTSPESQTIKYADVIDNCNEIVVYDKDFAGRFLYECRDQLKKLDKGDSKLYTHAINVVELHINQLLDLVGPRKKRVA